MNNNFIKNNDTVRIKVIRNKVILHNINTCNRRATIKRIGGGRHINVRTGEIVEETRQVKRGDSMYSLIESNLKLQDIIKENTINTDHILFITLTYAQKIFDIKKVNEDFKVFMKWLRRNITEFGTIEYISTVALHSDKTSYHIHAILFFNESTKSAWLDKDLVERVWKKGFAWVGKPKRNRDVYFYLTPHLSNEVTNKNSHMHKNALLQMELPAGQNLYHCSKGIKKPIIRTDTYETIKKYLKENSYELEKEQIYLNPMKAHRGNNLYYCKETYKKEETKSYGLGKRTPI